MQPDTGLQWRKSSHSGSGQSQCVETAAVTEGLVWAKSSYSGGTPSECVETAPLATGVAVRDSKNPTGPVLVFPASAWGAFLTAVNGDAFDA
jgi:hypothetical protein